MRNRLLRSAAGLLAEILSVFLPVLVIWLGAHHYQIDIRSSPEWAVGSIILFGQACVKFTTSIASVRSSKGPMSLIIVLLVSGIVIACYLLVRATEVEQGHRINNTHIYEEGYEQVICFLVSAIVYMGLGLLCDLGLKDSAKE